MFEWPFDLDRYSGSFEGALCPTRAAPPERERARSIATPVGTALPVPLMWLAERWAQEVLESVPWWLQVASGYW